METILALDRSLSEKNLLNGFDYYIEKDSTSNLQGTVMFDLRDDVDPQSLLNQTLTLSLYVDAPSERGTSIDPESGNHDRFGCHLWIRWKDSTGTLEDSYTYPCTDLLTQSVSDKYIESAALISAPEGYDTISAVRVAIFINARPADENMAVWALGYPQLRIN